MKVLAAFIVALLVGATPILSYAAGTPLQPAHDGLDFRLSGPSHKIYTRESFPADATLVLYFGYTTCWRACPVALNTIAAAVDSLGPQANHVVPVFVSFDSERETQEIVDLYLRAFGPRFVGLTGSAADIAKTAKTFDVEVERIVFSKEPGDYAMQHVSPILVWRPTAAQPERLAADISSAELKTAIVKGLEH